ncbi:MAG: putative zinc-binding metallopeptidase [Terriglobales bacterium]
MEITPTETARLPGGDQEASQRTAPGSGVQPRPNPPDGAGKRWPWDAGAPPTVAASLSCPIRELGLKVEGSPLEAHVERLYRELERKGLGQFRPRCYLTDEWGCPSGEPVIGIPFYLADERLAWLERETNDLETGREVMMYLRHEAGHAFNYAYRLYREPEWRTRFGPYRRPYREHYAPIAFSRDYVRHIGGWYAQKHPDEDFAETFAVWLTPGSRWRQKYRAWGALAKLRYVERTARRLRSAAPLRARGRTDITTAEMEETVGEFYSRARSEQEVEQRQATAEWNQILAANDGAPAGSLTLDADLADIFNVHPRRRRGLRPAAALVAEHRKTITDKVAYWTEVPRPLVRRLMEAMEKRLQVLALPAEQARTAEHLAELTTYTTALAMNFRARRSRRRRPGKATG